MLPMNAAHACFFAWYPYYPTPLAGQGSRSF